MYECFACNFNVFIMCLCIMTRINCLCHIPYNEILKYQYVFLPAPVPCTIISLMRFCHCFNIVCVKTICFKSCYCVIFYSLHVHRVLLFVGVDDWCELFELVNNILFPEMLICINIEVWNCIHLVCVIKSLFFFYLCINLNIM